MYFQKNVKSFSSLSSTTYLSVESVADLTKSVRNTTKKTGKRSLSYAGDDEGKTILRLTSILILYHPAYITDVIHFKIIVIENFVSCIYFTGICGMFKNKMTSVFTVYVKYC